MVNGTKMKGPLSWDQVLLEHQEEIIQKETLLWTQGLSEWQSFDSIKVSRSAPTPPQAPPFIRPAKPLPTPQPNFAFRKKARASKAKRFILTALCVVAFVPAARTVYLHYNQNEKLLEMVRHDLTASDFIKAQNFISQSTASVPETLIFAKAKAGLMPEFYFFAPLPDQQLVDFVLQGQPGDLLGKVRYQAVQTLPILNRMAKSSAFVQSNQAPLAQGIYSITLQDHLTKKPLATQSYFIGGQRDEDFEQRQEHIDQNRNRARDKTKAHVDAAKVDREADCEATDDIHKHMAGEHVHEKSDREADRAREIGHDLNRDDQPPHPPGNAGGQEERKEMQAVTRQRQQRHQRENGQSHRERDDDVARERETTRDQAEQIAGQDEKKDREHQRHVLGTMGTAVIPHHGRDKVVEHFRQ